MLPLTLWSRGIASPPGTTWSPFWLSAGDVIVEGISDGDDCNGGDGDEPESEPRSLWIFSWDDSEIGSVSAPWILVPSDCDLSEGILA